MRLRTAILLAALAIPTAQAFSAEPATPPKFVVVVKLDRPDAMYHAGEKATFTVTVKKEGEPVTAGKVPCAFSNDGIGDLGKSELNLGEPASTISGSLDQPGFLRLTATFKDGEQTYTGLAMAAYDPLKVQPSVKPPADWAAFWSAQKAALAKVPMAPQAQAEEKLSNPQVAVERVRLAGVEDTHVHAWVCRPKKEGKFPAVIMGLDAAVGPVPATNAVNWAREGFLAMAPGAYDLPLDESREYYAKLTAEGGPLADNRAGLADREKFQFRKFILGLLRCVDYLASRPDWDGRNIVITGGSFGGGMALAAAGLDGRITTVWVAAPAYCEMNGQLANRPRCGPRLDPDPDKLAAQVKTMSYYDAVHFCRKIECPTIFTFGLADTTCSPTTVYSGFNSLASKTKEAFIVPYKGHRSGQGEYWGAGLEFVKRHLRKAA